MKIALLGIDSQAALLADEILAHPDHELSRVFEASPADLPQAATAGTVFAGDDWAGLINPGAADAVVVARGPEERRTEQLRGLAQAEMPLVLVHPACSAILAFELDMIRTDTQTPMIAWVAGSQRPLFKKLREVAADRGPDALGPVEQIVMTRRLADRTRGAVLTQLATDAFLLRRLLGGVRRVSASGADPADEQFGNLVVTLAAESGAVARWAIDPVAAAAGASLVLIGARGRATLEMAAEPGDWSLTVGEGETAQETRCGEDEWREPAAVLTQLEQAVADSARESNWPAAGRALEIVDATERGLRRGKTIELYDEAHTEEETFKGLMAAGGCLTLLLTLAILVIMTMIDGLRPPFRDHFLWRIWPVYVLTPILIFLLLQTLKFAFREPPAAGANGRDSSGSGSKQTIS